MNDQTSEMVVQNVRPVAAARCVLTPFGTSVEHLAAASAPRGQHHEIAGTR